MRHRAQAPDQGGRKLKLGPQRAEGAQHGGECAPQAPGCLSRSGGEGTKRRRSFLFRAFVELPRAGTAQRRARTIENRREPEQRRQESSARPSPQRDGTSNPNESTSARLCEGGK